MYCTWCYIMKVDKRILCSFVTVYGRKLRLQNCNMRRPEVRHLSKVIIFFAHVYAASPKINYQTRIVFIAVTGELFQNVKYKIIVPQETYIIPDRVEAAKIDYVILFIKLSTLLPNSK